MIQCQACHYQGLVPADLAGHIQAVHGFGRLAATAEADRVAGVIATEDETAFGKDAWVYCNQHLAAHKTGWCTISPRDKIGLGVTTSKEADEKCRAWGLKLYHDLYPS